MFDCSKEPGDVIEKTLLKGHSFQIPDCGGCRSHGMPGRGRSRLLAKSASAADGRSSRMSSKAPVPGATVTITSKPERCNPYGGDATDGILSVPRS